MQVLLVVLVGLLPADASMAASIQLSVNHPGGGAAIISDSTHITGKVSDSSASVLITCNGKGQLVWPSPSGDFSTETPVRLKAGQFSAVYVQAQTKTNRVWKTIHVAYEPDANQDSGDPEIVLENLQSGQILSPGPLVILGSCRDLQGDVQGDVLLRTDQHQELTTQIDADGKFALVLNLLAGRTSITFEGTTRDGRKVKQSRWVWASTNSSQQPDATSPIVNLAPGPASRSLALNVSEPLVGDGTEPVDPCRIEAPPPPPPVTYTIDCSGFTCPPVGPATLITLTGESPLCTQETILVIDGVEWTFLKLSLCVSLPSVRRL